MSEIVHNRIVGMSFHPAFFARKFGADFGEKYHKDPFYHIEQDFLVQKKLYDYYGEFGFGDSFPKLNELGVSIQPLDFINIALGGKACYRNDESVWTPEKPLEEIETLDDLRQFPDIDWENNHELFDTWKQIEELQQAFPFLPVTTVQGVSALPKENGGALLIMHTPYTTAFRLLGEKIFEFMLIDEELAWAVFDFFTRQYKNLWQYICGKMGWHGINIHFGDCAATMLSPDLYEKYSLKIYQDYMREYQGCIIHSCGPSSHLLHLFAQIPNVKTLQLGAGTDLKKTRCLFPDSMIQAYYSPVELLTKTPTEIERKLWNMAEKLEDNFDIHVSSIDPETPEDNIQAYMKTALEIQQ